MLGEIGLPQHKQSRHRAHQVVVDPQTTHRVVGRGVDPHRREAGILAGDALVHLQQVAVARLNRCLAIAGDGVRQVEIHRPAPGTDTMARQALFAGPP